MDTTSHKIHVSDSIGEVSAIINHADDPWCAMTLAHGAGAGMTHAFMSGIARELALRGVQTMRFNFPFTEAEKKRPDLAPVAEKTVEAAIGFLLRQTPTLPLFCSGKSFGGRMSSQLISRQEEPSVKGLVFFGFPLHPAGKPGTTRAEHLKTVQVPMLFLQGTRDALAQLDLLESVTSSLPLVELQTFEGVDHALMRGKKVLTPELADAAVHWLKRQCGKA